MSYNYWNKGYATEALKKVIKYLFDNGFNVIEAEHHIDNIASGRVMEKCGLKFESYDEHSKRDGSVTYKVKNYRMHLK